MLNDSNYFSREMQMKYMSVSQFKAFEKCAAAALADLNGEYPRKETSALLVGSYVDSYFEGTLDSFKSNHADTLFKRDGSLKAEYSVAQAVIERIERDEMMMRYLDAPKQVIMTGVIADVPVKIKVDALHKDKICDLKVMRNFEPVYKPEQGKMSWIESWGYDLQGAVYQEIVRQNTGERLPFYLVAATKESEPDIGIFSVPQEILDFELEHFAALAPCFSLIKQGVLEAERCESCEYCRHTKILKKITTLGELQIDK